jgi:deazaflavin-dependent oxidoreductase (nitroreductase family)
MTLTLSACQFPSLLYGERRDKMSRQHVIENAQTQAKIDKENEKAPSFLVPIFKLPIFLYRLHLGWLVGKRFMQITHIGRRSGKVRRTILAVLRFDDKTKEIYAVSAWKGSDWYYNIQATPAVQVETGLVRYAPEQRNLSPEEITTAFLEYRKKHPIFSRMICRIPGWKWDSTYEEFFDLARTLNGVVF